MCVTFKSFLSLLEALEPQRVPLFAGHKSSPGHMVTDWHRLAKAEREKRLEKNRNRSGRERNETRTFI